MAHCAPCHQSSNVFLTRNKTTWHKQYMYKYRQLSIHLGMYTWTLHSCSFRGNWSKIKFTEAILREEGSYDCTSSKESTIQIHHGCTWVKGTACNTTQSGGQLHVTHLWWLIQSEWILQIFSLPPVHPLHEGSIWANKHKCTCTNAYVNSAMNITPVPPLTSYTRQLDTSPYFVHSSVTSGCRSSSTSPGPTMFWTVDGGLLDFCPHIHVSYRLVYPLV